MNRKLTTYQRLKVERSQLLQDIEKLVRHPESYESQEIKIKYKLMFDQEDMIWSGKSTYNER